MPRKRPKKIQGKNRPNNGLNKPLSNAWENGPTPNPIIKWNGKKVSTVQYLANKSGMNVIAVDEYIIFGGLFYPFPVPQNGAKWSSVWFPKK